MAFFVGSVCEYFDLVASEILGRRASSGNDGLEFSPRIFAGVAFDNTFDFMGERIFCLVGGAFGDGGIFFGGVVFFEQGRMSLVK